MSGTGASGVSDPLERLAPYLGDLFPGETFSVDTDSARAGGMSHLNLMAAGSGGTRLIVRVPPERGPLEPYDIVAEIAHYELARAAGVPVAGLVKLERDASVLGRPFAVFAYVPGSVLVPRKQWTSATEAAEIGQALLETLVAIHTVPVSSEPFDRLAVRRRRYDAADFVEQTAQRLHADSGEGLPVVLSFVELWLRIHVPATTEHSLVHGDYRLGNMIWIGTRIVAVLDWETAMITDPMYDLAWYLMNTFDDDDAVMGVMTRREVVAGYEARSGRTVDANKLGWWEILIAWSRVTIELHAIRLNEEIAVPDLRALAWEFGHGSAYRHMLRIIRRLTGPMVVPS